jgi:DNA-binding CsgD family transcriptional regulator
MITSKTVDEVFDLARVILTPRETVDFAGALLEPVACAIGADMAAFREINLGRDAPRIGRHASAGVPESLHSQYLDRFYKLDPAIGPDSPTTNRETDRETAGSLTLVNRTNASSPRPRLSDAHRRYWDDFLMPNRLLNSISLHIHARAQGKLFLMDFHRTSAGHGFSDRDLAVAQMVCPAVQLFCTQLVEGAAGSAAGTDRRLFRLGSPDRPSNAPCDLTAREKDVAMAVLKGMSDKEIARHLGISVRTAQNHLRNIYLKAEVHSRSQLMAKLIGAD